MNTPTQTRVLPDAAHTPTPIAESIITDPHALPARTVRTRGGQSALMDGAAKKAALAWTNGNRANKGLPPLPRISPLWWRIYGQEWINKTGEGAK